MWDPGPRRKSRHPDSVVEGGRKGSVYCWGPSCQGRTTVGARCFSLLIIGRLSLDTERTFFVHRVRSDSQFYTSRDVYKKLTSVQRLFRKFTVVLWENTLHKTFGWERRTIQTYTENPLIITVLTVAMSSVDGYRSYRVESIRRASPVPLPSRMRIPL